MDQTDISQGLEDSNLTSSENITPPKGLPKGVSGNILGRGIHRRKQENFEELKPHEQNAYLRDLWKSIALGVAERAKSFSTTCSPKDFGKLHQLVTTGATALDKAFPPRQEIQTPKLIFNLFNSLGQRATRIAVPEVPGVIDVSTKTVPVSPSVPSVIEEGGTESRGPVVIDSGIDRPVEDSGEL